MREPDRNHKKGNTRSKEIGFSSYRQLTMTSYMHLWLSLALLLLHIQGLRCLKDVTLRLEPEYVELGKHVYLHCTYDLEGAPLYSVKWYRGTREFCRYTPYENPPMKVFSFPEARFHVDLNYSNSTVALLKDVSFVIAGNVSCEVTLDAPTFKVRASYGVLRVVSLPKTRPELRVNKDKFSVGELLVANCTSGPSRPGPSLSFYINNSPVRVATETLYDYTPDRLYNSTAHLVMDLLPGDFLDDGQIALKCVSEIEEIYSQFTELRIGTKNGDPIPERVRSPGGTRGTSSRTSPYSWMMLLALLIAQHPATGNLIGESVLFALH